MRCPYCGVNFMDSEAVCPVCGRPVNADPAKYKSNTSLHQETQHKHESFSAKPKPPKPPRTHTSDSMKPAAAANTGASVKSDTPAKPDGSPKSTKVGVPKAETSKTGAPSKRVLSLIIIALCLLPAVLAIATSLLSAFSTSPALSSSLERKLHAPTYDEYETALSEIPQPLIGKWESDDDVGLMFVCKSNGTVKWFYQEDGNKRLMTSSPHFSSYASMNNDPDAEHLLNSFEKENYPLSDYQQCELRCSDDWNNDSKYDLHLWFYLPASVSLTSDKKDDQLDSISVYDYHSETFTSYHRVSG